MAYRPGVILQLGTITAIVDIDNAVQSVAGLKNVCLGPTGTEHIPTACKQQSLKCPDCGNDDPTTFKKAKVEAKQFVVVEKTEVADAKAGAVGATNKFISLLAHPAEEVHTQTIQGGGVYQLKAANQPMVQVVSLLLDTLRRHPELAFTGLWSPAGRVNFYEVRPFGDTLVMEERARTEELKIIQQPVAAIDPAFQSQVDIILAGNVVPYNPATYQDAYLQKLEAVLASKQAQDGILVPKGKSTPTVAGAVDLSAMLSAGLAGLKVA
jgi:non-homologous end joining protein Ku